MGPGLDRHSFPPFLDQLKLFFKKDSMEYHPPWFNGLINNHHKKNLFRKVCCVISRNSNKYHKNAHPVVWRCRIQPLQRQNVHLACCTAVEQHSAMLQTSLAKFSSSSEYLKSGLYLGCVLQGDYIHMLRLLHNHCCESHYCMTGMLGSSSTAGWIHITHLLWSFMKFIKVVEAEILKMESACNLVAREASPWPSQAT